MAIKIFLLVLFFGVMIFIGFWSRRHATNVNDYVLGGRTVGPWLTAFAFGTSYFSSVVFVGYAGQFGWKFGLASTWIGLGNALIGSLLAWIILGRRTRIMTQKLDARTMPEYFGKRYGSTALQVVGSIISFVFLVPYTAGVYNGLSRLFGMAFSIDYHVVIIIMALLTAVYVIAGGYMATALNDFIQGIIMLGGIAAVIAAVLHGQGGFLNAMKELSIIDASDVAKPALQGAEGLLTSFFGPDPMALLGVVILTSLGTWARMRSPSRPARSSPPSSRSSSPAAATSSAVSADSLAMYPASTTRTAPSPSTPSSRPCSRRCPISSSASSSSSSCPPPCRHCRRWS